MPRLAVLLLAILCVTVLAVSGPPAVLAKKPSPPPPPPSDPDPAIAYVARFKFEVDKIMVMNADGSNQTVVFDGESAVIGYRPDWSPDGTKLAFWSDVDGGGIYVYDLVTEALTKVCSTMTEFGFVISPVWSPVPVPEGAIGDGATYYLAYTDQGTDQINDVFLVEPAENSTPIQLTDTEEDFEIGPTWSASARTLLVKWAHDAYRVGDQFVVFDLVAGTSQRIQHTGDFQGEGVGDYRFCNGTEDKLVCTADGDIWTFELDGENTPKNLTRLTDTPSQERCPCWSADDSKIVFMGFDDEGKGTALIDVMSSADGSGRTTLVSGTARAPTWIR